MKPTKAGQIAKFHTPMPDEDPGQLYVVLEIKEDTERPRADIKALNSGVPLTPINTVPLADLEVAEVSTSDLIGRKVTVSKTDKSFITGKVVSAHDQKIMLDMDQATTGIKTNVQLTIIDDDGIEQTGTLFVQ